jgi:hypothetical protein
MIWTDTAKRRANRLGYEVCGASTEHTLPHAVTGQRSSVIVGPVTHSYD